MGKGGCTAAGRAARSKAQGQPDLSEGCVRRDDAYKVPQTHFYVEIVDRVPLPRSGGGGRGRGQMRPRLPLERICAQYEFRFFFPEKSKFVASTAKRQEGLSRGKPGPP